MLLRQLSLVVVMGTASLSTAAAREDGSGAAVLIASPAVRTGETLFATLVGPPSADFLILADVGDGPVQVGPHTICLGLTPFVRVIGQGKLPLTGIHTAAVAVPNLPIMANRTLSLQGLLLDSAAPKGIGGVSNGARAVVYSGARAIVQTFDGSAPQFNNDAFIGPYTGQFDSSVTGRLQAEPLQRWTNETSLVPNTPSGVTSPLNGDGARSQHVYPAEFFQGGGTIIGMDWKPIGGQTFADFFPSVEIRLSHSKVVPDIRLNPGGFPVDPLSGLDATFPNNISPGEIPVVVVPPGTQMIIPDGQGVDWLPWPIFQETFDYNGTDSLLVDIGVVADSTSLTANAFELHQRILGWAVPYHRIYSTGGPLSGPIHAPFAESVALGLDRQGGSPGDTGVVITQFHFAVVETEALSPYLGAAIQSPDYRSAVAAIEGQGDVRFEFRGALLADGTGATPFSPSIDVADGFPFIQFKVIFTADYVDGIQPAIDTLVIEYD
ncbi:MAG: hypothetical protein RL885_03610 [Planctomycetota bacterium]